MERFSVGDEVGLFVDGVLVDRGRVRDFIEEQGVQILTIVWEHRGTRISQGEDVRRLAR